MATQFAFMLTDDIMILASYLVYILKWQQELDYITTIVVENTMEVMYDKIELHESVEFMLSNGTTLKGEVVGKDSDWITICTSDSNKP